MADKKKSKKSPQEEKDWKRAEELAKAHDHAGNYAYTMSIYTDIQKGHEKDAGAKVKLSSMLKKIVVRAKASKKPTVFLGGQCDDSNAWRKEVIKEYGDRLFFIDPYDKEWEASDNIYDELAGMTIADHVIFFKGGDGTKKEKEFLKIVTGDKDYEAFDDIGEMKTYLSNLAKPIRTVKACYAYVIRKHAASLLKLSKKNGKYDSSSTQIDLPEDFAEQVMAWGKKNIPDDVLHNDEGNTSGREDEIHTTLFYGLEDANPEATEKLLSGHAPFDVRLGLVTAFKDKDEYDVIKVDVESPEMQKLHYLIEEKLPNKNDYPTYSPHMTVAYVQKGKADDVIGDDTFKGKTFKVGKITFSSKNGTKTQIKLKGKG